MRELYCTAVPKNHKIDARRLHLARRHTEAVGLCVHAMFWFWDDHRARYSSASRLCMNQLLRHSTSRAVAYVSVIETQARGSLNQHLLLDDGTEAVVLYAAKYMMKTGRRRGGRIESTEK